MLNLSAECWGLVALTSLLGVGCSYTATVSAQRTFTFPLHLYFQWYQHTELHQHRLWTSSGSVSHALMEREDFLLTAAAQEPCPGWCRKGTAGWVALVMATAQLDTAGKGLSFLRLILHTDPEQPAPALLHPFKHSWYLKRFPGNHWQTK